jgi:hypothetical protein
MTERILTEETGYDPRAPSDERAQAENLERVPKTGPTDTSAGADHLVAPASDAWSGASRDPTPGKSASPT